MGMGYSGLIYAVIVAAWAGVLIPRWLRRNEEIDHARETDAARGVRVLQRRAGHPHTAHHDREPPADATSNVHSANSGADAAPSESGGKQAGRSGPGVTELDELFALAAARRRRVLVILLGACALSIYAAFDALLPAWAPAVAFAALGWFLVTARRAVIRQARRRRHAVRLAARAEVSGDVVDDADESTDEDALRVAVLDVPEVEQPDPNAWDPVDVPRPTYMSKPAAPRIVRTIDLAQPGSWTSGRLDATGAIEPRRQVSTSVRRDADTERYDEMPERKRAVGD